MTKKYLLPSGICYTVIIKRRRILFCRGMRWFDNCVMIETENSKEHLSDRRNGGIIHRYGPYIFITALIGYIVLLGIGVIAELFDIQSILDWWIWRPPGKQ
jgi:hypothetical protein